MVTTRRSLGLATALLFALPTIALAAGQARVEAPACSVDSLRLRIPSVTSQVVLGFEPEFCLCDTEPGGATEWLTRLMSDAANASPEDDPIEYLRSVEAIRVPAVVFDVGEDPEPSDVTIYCYTEQMIRDYWVEFHESASTAEVVTD